MSIYKLIILDNNTWMYLDMAYQAMTILETAGDRGVLIAYSDIRDGDKCIFFGTKYGQYPLPVGSIVTNFDNDTLLFSIISDNILQTCEVWDYSIENIELMRAKVPDGVYKHFVMGYTPILDYGVGYNEPDKVFDVLLVGSLSNRREIIMRALDNAGLHTKVIYRCVGEERAELIKQSRLCISMYSGDNRHCISASRMTPILCNNGLIVTEICSNPDQEAFWSKYTISVTFEDVCETVYKLLRMTPEARKQLADGFYAEFIKTQPRLIDA